jgi:hypothetical protein
VRTCFGEIKDPPHLKSLPSIDLYCSNAIHRNSPTDALKPLTILLLNDLPQDLKLIRFIFAWLLSFGVEEVDMEKGPDESERAGEDTNLQQYSS